MTDTLINKRICDISSWKQRYLTGLGIIKSSVIFHFGNQENDDCSYFYILINYLCYRKPYRLMHDDYKLVLFNFIYAGKSYWPKFTKFNFSCSLYKTDKKLLLSLYLVSCQFRSYSCANQRRFTVPVKINNGQILSSL